MTERWICARCYTSAEESATECPNCGLPRGATFDATAGKVEPAAAAAPETESSPEAVSGPAAEVVLPIGADAGRWVCLRCFASNDAAAAPCGNCGLERGADPSADQTGGWAGTMPTAAQPARGFPWRLVVYGVIAVVVLGGSVLFAARRGDTGEITGSGDMSVFDLRVGDCFDVSADSTSADSTEIETVRAIPCDEAHVYEMFWSGEYPGETQPAEDEYLAWLQDQCLPAFEAYVGISYENSVFYMSYLSPTEASWGGGDRAFACYLHNESEAPLTGSARGAGE